MVDIIEKITFAMLLKYTFYEKKTIPLRARISVISYEFM